MNKFTIIKYKIIKNLTKSTSLNQQQYNKNKPKYHKLEPQIAKEENCNVWVV